MPKIKLRFESLLPVLLALATLALWWPSFRIFFSLDDLEFLLRAAGRESWPDVFRRPLSTQLFFEAAWSLFGTKAGLYHLVGFLFHLSSAGMMLLIGRRLRLSSMGAFAAALLFALTPVAFTSLHWISGVQELSMAFFALLAAWLALGESRGSAWGALAAFAVALLCKESAALLLPGLALLLPGERRRRLFMGLGGLGLALLVLLASRSFAPKPAGDPYETAFGMNLLWNLGSYLAWIARVWDAFPDRIARYQSSLAPWGFALPALLALAAWRRPDWRKNIGRASLLFLLLLLPVLPLLRHSYFYYLYLPLAPLWLLAGEGLARLDRGRRWVIVPLMIAFALLSAWQMEQRRDMEMGGGLLDDPMIRYAKLAETAVATMSEAQVPKKGDLLILAPFLGESQDLSRGMQEALPSKRVQFLPVDRALLGGRALGLFFPEIASARFANEFPEGDDWRRQALWWTYGNGKLAYLGLGEQGRHRLAQLFYELDDPARAVEQLRALLELHPHDANLLHDLGAVELSMDDLEATAQILATLKALAEQPGADETTRRAHADLWKLFEPRIRKLP